jgi:hypothetical protein
MRTVIKRIAYSKEQQASEKSAARQIIEEKLWQRVASGPVLRPNNARLGRIVQNGHQQ